MRNETPWVYSYQQQRISSPPSAAAFRDIWNPKRSQYQITTTLQQLHWLPKRNYPSASSSNRSSQCIAPSNNSLTHCIRDSPHVLLLNSRLEGRDCPREEILPSSAQTGSKELQNEIVFQPIASPMYNVCYLNQHCNLLYISCRI